MPVGIPKIPFQGPEEEEASWVDIYNRLYREGLLFLCQEINPETSNHVIGLMIYLSLEDPSRDLFLFINSPGGGVTSGIALYDTMQYVPPDVHTICIGLAASMGSFILAGGEITKRMAFPHAVMMHQPSSSFFDGEPWAIDIEMRELLRVREMITTIYVQKTGQPPWLITRDLERDTFMSATEAKDYGIIDFVATDFGSRINT
uniref:Clp protease proteolytic subunit n=1 Tax=Amorphophallus muelleri TaxID=175741 RepID=UPI00300305B2|nr:Clp protease proteolytic subunit [Amorphophallus muelleri]